VKARPWVALLLGASMVVLAGAAVPLAVWADQASFGNLVVLLLMVPFGAVGLVVAARQPRNAIGWILIALTLTVILGTNAGFYAVLSYRVDDHALPLGRLAVALSPSWVPVLVLMPLPILLFPDGRVPGGGWRWTFWIYLSLIAAFLIDLGNTDAGAFSDRHLSVASSGELAALNAPTTGADATFGTVLVIAYASLFLAWALRQLLRYRRSRGDERQQLKWFLSGGAVGVIGMIVAATTAASLAFAGVVALPIGLGFGILKYRLYEIDRLLSRTVSYAILTALLAGTFVGIVALTTDLLPFSSSVGVAASTLAAAALFNPLRKRVQRIVDRRFNRARYDAEQTVAAFAASLRDAVDIDAIQAELLHVVQQAVEPAHTTIWIRRTDAR
jgi:hypothetical protein